MINFEKYAELTDYINSLVGQKIEYGQNDCNLLALKILDIQCGTNYHDQIQGQYSDVRNGYKKAKEILKYTNAIDFIKKHYTEQDKFTDGCLLVKKIKDGRSYKYHISVTFSNYALVGKDGYFIMIPAIDADYDIILGI